MTDRRQFLREIRRYQKLVRQSCETMSSAGSASELRDLWESYLAAFARCIGRLISMGLKDEASRAWAHQLKNDSLGNDPGLFFLREARNLVEHGVTPFAQFEDPSVLVAGGALKIGGNSSVSVGSITVNGVPYGGIDIQTHRGRVKRVSGSPFMPISEIPSSIRLEDIRNPETGKIAKKPHTLGGVAILADRPADLAAAGVTYLEVKIAELRDLWWQG